MRKILLFFFALSIIFYACKKEKKQIKSPIDIQTAQKDSTLKPLTFAYYQIDTVYIENNQNSISIKFPETKLILPDSAMPDIGVEYNLDNFKIVFPSEHKIKGEQFEAEVQMFFKSDSGKWVAVAFFISPTEDTNFVYQNLINSIPQSGSGYYVDTNGINFRRFLPRSINYWCYDGTFTDSPKPLKWFIFQEPVYLNKSQIDQLKSKFQAQQVPLKNNEGIKVREF